MKNTELWKKLENFNMEDPSSEFTMVQRLARENGWNYDYAKRVTEEYKKFLYLSCVENTSLTPSDEVDQAWHLHMLYTESYWEDLCKNTLNRKFNHGPTKGGSKEKMKYNELYTKTLLLYKENFGTEAPSDIWPSVEKRFSNVVYQRVNMHENYVLNKTKVKAYMATYVLAPLLVILASLTMYAEKINWGKTFLVILCIVVAIWIIRGIYRYITRNDRGGGSSGSGSSDSGCTIAGSFFGCAGSGCSSSGCSSCGSGCSGCGGCGGCS